MKGLFKVKKKKIRTQGQGIVAYMEGSQCKLSVEAGTELKLFTVTMLLHSVAEDKKLTQDDMKGLLSEMMEWE